MERGLHNFKRLSKQGSNFYKCTCFRKICIFSQEAGMVPIVEPEVLMEGNHNSNICLDKTTEVIKKCFDELILQKVDLKGIILKPNMILPEQIQLKN